MFARVCCVALTGLLTACAAVPPRAPALARAAASSVRDIADLREVGPALAAQTAPVLLVLDIDDTLLTSGTFFGSDRWYEWQKTLRPNDPGYVPCRFDVIAMNYEVGTQHATQPGTGPAAIDAIASDKLILTARNPNYRGGTERELAKAGYAFPEMLTRDGAALAYAWQADAGQRAVDVDYRHGIFMVSGQDKGRLLLDLLERTGRSYTSVVLVDDGDHNIVAMREALAKAGIDYLGLHYTGVDKTVGDDDRRAGVRTWEAWSALLAQQYPQRFARLDKNECQY